MGQIASALLHGQVPSWILGQEEDVTYDAEVKCQSGVIRGKKFRFHDHKVQAFLGVPYARCGAYSERFKKPLPVKQWEGTLDCTKFGPRSIQQDMLWDYYLTPVYQDEENCLNMSIFAPEDKSGHILENRPVMVFIHGGAYLIHSAANYGDRQICRNLCRHGVIVCVIQYRLGLLGFLSTGDSECPGNFGLWDQRAALLWIKDNIAAFGGDPNNITAVGQSAGAAAIDLLSISPRCEGLIQKVILMAGNAASNWAVVPWERTAKAAMTIARRGGWKGEEKDYHGLVKWFRTQPVSRCKATLLGKSAFDSRRKGLDFCPVIDGDFLPKPVDELRREARQVKAIIGTTDYEALLFLALGRAQADIGSIEKQLAIQIPESLSNSSKLREEARLLYLRNVDDKNKTEVARAFVRLYSDTLMNNSTIRYATQMSSLGNDVYLYNMTYFNPGSFGLFAMRMPFIGPTHCYDLRYVFGKGMFSKFRPDSNDLIMLDLITTMWTNFATTGNPNGSLKTNWKPVTPANPYSHFDINLEPEQKSDYQGRRAEFWEKVPSMMGT